MISCRAFRDAIRPGNDDPATLEHLRSCDACLEFAVATDPDNYFRAIGGGELTPPGGVDQFVSEVMSQVRMREIGPKRRDLPLIGVRAAAAVLLIIGSATAGYRYSRSTAVPPPPPALVAAVARVPLTTKPVVETYQSRDATIVEVPNTGDARVVMIYDQALPADL